MKKLKGFTLVELIVVTAIFSLIMVAVLSILNPIGEVYNKTANYEHMRAASDNLRMYVEDNIRYADKMQVVYNSNQASAEAKAKDFVNAYKDPVTNKFTVSSNEANGQPLYIMEILNPALDGGIPDVADTRDGEVTIYQFTSGTSISIADAKPYKSSDSSLYDNYYYHFDSSNIQWYNAVLDIDVYKKGFDDKGDKGKLEASDERFFKLSNTASFSFVNLREIQRRFDEATEVKYYNYDGVECDKDTPGAIKVDKTKEENAPYKKNVDATTGTNIYFIYTLPKFANEY